MAVSKLNLGQEWRHADLDGRAVPVTAEEMGVRPLVNAHAVFLLLPNVGDELQG